jgi:hypothetical protein
MIAQVSRLSGTQRAAAAACLTAVLVAPFELVSIYRGWFPGYEIAVLGMPWVFAMFFYGRLKAPLVAWVLLTLVSILSAFTVIAVWTFWMLAA